MRLRARAARSGTLACGDGCILVRPPAQQPATASAPTPSASRFGFQIVGTIGRYRRWIAQVTSGAEEHDRIAPPARRHAGTRPGRVPASLLTARDARPRVRVDPIRAIATAPERVGQPLAYGVAWLLALRHGPDDAGGRSTPSASAGGTSYITGPGLDADPTTHAHRRIPSVRSTYLVQPRGLRTLQLFLNSPHLLLDGDPVKIVVSSRTIDTRTGVERAAHDVSQAFK